MHSKIVLLEPFLRRIRRIVRQTGKDRISLYAAQASFFVITSVVPFVSLLLTIIGLVLPTKVPALSLSGEDGLSVLLRTLGEGIREAPGVPLLSLSAVTTLWSASRGVSAIRRGIETVYRVDEGHSYVIHRLRSLVSTVIFLLSLTAAAVVLLFGDTLFGMLGENISLLFRRLRTPLFIAAMIVVFTAVYVSVARRSTAMPSGIGSHLPGAVFSSLGWMVFSYGYSLYITYFPRASSIYGGLAAICLIMLWLYFCMLIFLFGAEVNKLRLE